MRVDCEYLRASESGYQTMPSLFRFLTVVAILCAAVYARSVFARTLRATEAARDHRRDPAGKILQEPLRALATWVATRRSETFGERTRGAGHSDERLTALFLDMLAAERGAGKNTLAAYGRDLADFGDHLADGGRAVATATTDDVRDYLGVLAKRGMLPTTVARRLSAIRQLYRFLYAEGQRKDDPAAVLEGPKRARTLPKTLSLAEVDRLLRVAGQCDPDAPLSLRLRAARLSCLVELLYATGLRVSELVALPASAARRDARVIVVRGKGNKERLVPLNDAAKRAMVEYLGLLSQPGGGKEARIEMAVSILRRQRPSYPSAFRARTQSASPPPPACARCS